MLVKYLWNDDLHAYSGIPPCIVLLQKMEKVCEQQELLLNLLVEKLQRAIDELVRTVR